MASAQNKFAFSAIEIEVFFTVDGSPVVETKLEVLSCTAKYEGHA